MFGRKNDLSEIKEDLKEIKKKFDAISTVPVVSNPVSSTDIGNVIKEWEIVIKTQMHFNDLLMKLRTTTLSIVLAIFGAAGYSILSKDIIVLTLNGFSFHPSLIIISAGLVLLVSMFIMDYFYYYKLLLGSVIIGTKFDQSFKTEDSSWNHFGLTTDISNKFGTDDRSKYSVFAFYIIPFVASLFFMGAILCGYVIPSPEISSG